MIYYNEEFYQEPSEFDMLVDDFKKSLTESIKDEYVAEMEKLKKENAELQDIKNDFENIKRDYESRKRELERERNDLQSKVRRERLVDLLEDHKITMYRAYSERKYPEKCDKCDDRRQIKYTSPLGRKTSEDCLCRNPKTVYFPKEFIRYEFKLNRDKNGLTAWYRQYGDNEDGFVNDNSILADNIYSTGMSFEEINSYNTFFKTEEECLAYCEFLNKKISA